MIIPYKSTVWSRARLSFASIRRRFWAPLGVLVVLAVLVLRQQDALSTLREAGILPGAEQAESFEAAWPSNIWQTGSDSMAVKWKKEVQTWKNLNPGWKYGFLGDQDCTKYVNQHFRNQPTIHSFWHGLNATILKADLIRYLTMLAEGGVYSDIDTSCLKPIVEWIPSEYEEKDIRVVAGIEYDDTTYPMFARPISLCQWTLMAKPKHAVFQKVVARVIGHLEYLARIKHVELDELKLDKKEVLDATGPGAFTDSIMEVISESEGRRVAWKELSQMREPKLYGDVLILPINAFASGQKHSHSGDAVYGPKLVKHHFGRSWYTSPGKKGGKEPALKKPAKKKPAA